MPLIGHPDYPICAHLTVKRVNIVEPDLLGIKGTSCNPGRERLLPSEGGYAMHDHSVGNRKQEM
jgi:hypothetical protein